MKKRWICLFVENDVGGLRRGEPGFGLFACRGRRLQFVFQSQFVDLL